MTTKLEKEKSNIDASRTTLDYRSDDMTSNPESTDVELNLDLSSGSSMKESDAEAVSVKDGLATARDRSDESAKKGSKDSTTHATENTEKQPQRNGSSRQGDRRNTPGIADKKEQQKRPDWLTSSREEQDGTAKDGAKSQSQVGGNIDEDRKSKNSGRERSASGRDSLKKGVQQEEQGKDATPGSSGEDDGARSSSSAARIRNDDRGNKTDDEGHKTDEKRHKTDEKGHKEDEKRHKTDEKRHKTDEKGHKTDEKGHKEDEKRHKTDEKGHKEDEKRHKTDEKGHKEDEKRHKTDEKGHKTDEKGSTTDRQERKNGENDDKDYEDITEDTNDNAHDLTEDDESDDVDKDKSTEKYDTPPLRRKPSSKRRSASYKQKQKAKEDTSRNKEDTPRNKEDTPRNQDNSARNKDTPRNKADTPRNKDNTPRNKDNTVRNKDAPKTKEGTPRNPSKQRSHSTTPKPEKQKAENPKSQSNQQKNATPRQASRTDKTDQGASKFEPQKSKYTGPYSRKGPAQKPNRSTSQRSLAAPLSQRNSVVPSRSTSKNRSDTTGKPKDTPGPMGRKVQQMTNSSDSHLAAFNSPKERVDIEIFKAKEPLYYHAFQWNDEVFREMVHSGIFSQDELFALRDAVSPRARYGVLLDALRAGDGLEDLQALALSLQTCNVDMAQELHAEIDLALGELITEERIFKESARLVHLQFGAKKRLAEEDKKVISRILGERNQIMKHIWEKKTMRMVIDTKREEDRGKQLDAVILELSTMLHDYVTHNLPGEIPTRILDTLQGGRERMPYDGPPVSSGYPDHNPDAGILEGTVVNLCDQVVGLIDAILEARDERYRTIHDVLELRIDADKADTEDLVEKALLAAIARKREEGNKISELDALIAELEAEEARESKVISKLHLYREKDMDELNEKIPRGKHELQEATDELRELRQLVRLEREEFEDEIMRAESLEKGSRINSIYRKDTEKKTGKKLKVRTFKLPGEKDEDYGTLSHDVTRTMGHKFKFETERKQTRSVEMMEDLEIL